jgi:hypothetical protein
MSLADAQQQAGLLTAAKQSAFGHKKKTVVDTSVRVAQELSAAEFSVDFDPAAAGILEQVGQQGVGVGQGQLASAKDNHTIVCIELFA